MTTRPKVEELTEGPRIGICDHTSQRRDTYSDSWITPEPILDLVRLVYGDIDYDLASSAEANVRVRARRYWSQGNPCPQEPNLGGVVWANPPGPGARVKEFWGIWNRLVIRGCTGAFLIFKQDHWRQLPAPAFSATAIVLRKRLAFTPTVAAYADACRRAEAKGKPKPPLHAGANFPSTLILSPGDWQNEALYYDALTEFGHVLPWGSR